MFGDRLNDGIGRFADLVDFQRARLLGLGNLADEVNVKQPILGRRPGGEHMIGELETLDK